MRLDKFLKVSRLLKRRSLAAEACSLKTIKVNGREAKASRSIKEGDIIEINLATVYLKVRVEEVPKGNIRKNQAHTLYSPLEERRKDWRNQL